VRVSITFAGVHSICIPVRLAAGAGGHRRSGSALPGYFTPIRRREDWGIRANSDRREADQKWNFGTSETQA
jgi:hypothetical protein